MKYDVAIIGGGPGGYTAALKAAKNGLSVILFEKRQLGGTCLNRGCIPTKALLKSANIYKEAKESEVYGINVTDVSFDLNKIKQRKNEIVLRLRTDIEKAMKASKITVINGLASVNKDKTIICNNETFEASNIVIASGSKPAMVPIEGHELLGVYTSDDLLEKDEIDFDSIVIVGGGVIGCEFASLYLSLGKQVTILEMADHILPPMDGEVAQRLTMYLKKQGALIETKAKVSKFTKDNDNLTVTYLNKDEEEKTVSTQAILMATGRKADVAEVFNEELGIELNRGAIVGDKQGKTNIDGLYVIGDAKFGNIQLAHVAMAQGENIIDIIMNKEESVDTDLVPSCIYTSPEIATVGLSENQAKENGLNVYSKKYLTGANGKNVIENGDNGYVKLVVNADNNVIIGAQIVALHATDLIGELCVVIKHKLTIDQLGSVIHPHPTLCEMLYSVTK